MVVTVFMTALFLKNCRQCKNWKRWLFFDPFYPWGNKNLQKIKHSQNFEASVEAKNTKTKIISILPKSGKSIKKSLFGPKNACYALKHLARYTPILCQI